MESSAINGADLQIRMKGKPGSPHVGGDVRLPYRDCYEADYFTSQVSPARIMSRRVLKPFLARTSATCSVTPSL